MTNHVDLTFLPVLIAIVFFLLVHVNIAINTYGIAKTFYVTKKRRLLLVHPIFLVALALIFGLLFSVIVSLILAFDSENKVPSS